MQITSKKIPAFHTHHLQQDEVSYPATHLQSILKAWSYHHWCWRIWEWSCNTALTSALILHAALQKLEFLCALWSFRCFMSLRRTGVSPPALAAGIPRTIPGEGQGDFPWAKNMISKLCLAPERLDLDFVWWRQLSDPLALEDLGEGLIPSFWGWLHTNTAWGLEHHSQAWCSLRTSVSCPSTTPSPQIEAVTAPARPGLQATPELSRSSGACLPQPWWLRGAGDTCLLSNRCFQAWIGDQGNFQAECGGALQCRKQTGWIIVWALGFRHLSLNLSRLVPAES